MIEYENGKEMKCPKCGANMIHPVAVYVLCGNIRHAITCDGYEEIQGVGNNADGVIIVREFRCESDDYKWLEIDEFTHGSVYQETKEIEPLLGNMKNIWRI